MNTYLFSNTQTEIKYNELTGAEILAEVESIEQRTNLLVSNLKMNVLDETEAAQVLHLVDDIFGDIEILLGSLNLLAFVLPENEPRNAAQECMARLGKLLNSLWMNEKMYHFIKSANDYIYRLSTLQRRFFTLITEEYERKGVHLEADKRNEIQQVLDRLSELDVEFESNIAAVSDELILGVNEMDGLPEDFKESHLQEDGTYKIGLSYPDYRPFMKYAHSQEARKQLFMKFMNRAAESNTPVLNEMVALRKKLAEMLGYKSFAHYALGNKMAKKPKNVWDFEQDLLQKVREKAQSDLNALIDLKKKMGMPQPSVVYQWEVSYLSDILLREHYQIDDQELKQYFELGNVLKGAFEVASKLTGVQIVEKHHKYLWHTDVKYYEVIENGQTLACFYLDLFPRENKFSHAAMFPMVPGKHAGTDADKKPVAALVCNFPKPFADKPSLLGHRDVVTFFHEFGHLLHGLLTKSEFSMLAGTSVARDYVETPSQLFENWAWEYDSLVHFATHYQTGNVLPADLHARMVRSKLFNSGLDTLQQLFYGILDMTLHDTYVPGETMTINEVVRNLQNRMLLYPFEEGTHFECSFGHLSGYAAGYYGYMWAKVYSEDIFSVFKNAGVFNTNLGEKLRNDILSMGSTVDEMEQLKNFLDREPSNVPFLQSIGC